MALTVEIGTLTFTIQPFVKPETEYEHRPDGRIYSRTERWNLNGWFVGDESGLKTDRDVIRAQIETGVQNVVIKKDGVNHITLLTSEHLRSPRFENYRENGKGLFTNTINFSVDLLATKSIQISNIYKPEQTEAVREGKDGTEKVLTVSASGPGAESYVKGLKPGGGNVTESRFLENVHEDRWTAVYTEKPGGGGGGGTSAGKKLESKETVTVSGGLVPIAFYPRTNNKPFRIDGALQAATVTVRGTVEALADNFGAITGDFKSKFTNISKELTEENLLTFDDGVPFVKEFTKPEKPRIFARNYTATFLLDSRPAVASLVTRIKRAFIV